jgi:hypothetical protein
MRLQLVVPKIVMPHTTYINNFIENIILGILYLARLFSLVNLALIKED